MRDTFPDPERVLVLAYQKVRLEAKEQIDSLARSKSFSMFKIASLELQVLDSNLARGELCADAFKERE